MPRIQDNEVLVKVKSTAICGTDIHIYEWTKYAQDRLKLPMVFGHEFSGEIVEVGSKVENFEVGDRVAGETHIPVSYTHLDVYKRQVDAIWMYGHLLADYGPVGSTNMDWQDTANTVSYTHLIIQIGCGLRELVVCPVLFRNTAGI